MKIQFPRDGKGHLLLDGVESSIVIINVAVRRHSVFVYYTYRADRLRRPTISEASRVRGVLLSLARSACGYGKDGLPSAEVDIPIVVSDGENISKAFLSIPRKEIESHLKSSFVVAKLERAV